MGAAVERKYSNKWIYTEGNREHDISFLLIAFQEYINWYDIFSFIVICSKDLYKVLHMSRNSSPIKLRVLRNVKKNRLIKLVEYESHLYILVL